MILPVVSLTLLIGCAGGNALSTCQTLSALGWPIYLEQADVLTRQTAEVVVATNEFGERRCEWQTVN
jgi:hypothetical protein